MNEYAKPESDRLFGPNGFLLDARDWHPELARQIAGSLGIGKLGQAHWQVIAYLREHHLKFGSLPWGTHLCKTLEWPADCVHTLFGGPVEAWKVAGLPDPGEEARTYMLNQE